MVVLETELMQTILDIIQEEHSGLPRDDKSKLSLTEIRPRSSEFSKVALSCSIAPNDPSDPDKWLDEEMTNPGAAYNAYPGKQYTELGIGQFYNTRFTIDFNLFFQNLDADKIEALESAQLIFKRIHHAIIREGDVRNGKFARLRKADDFGHHLVRSNNAVKKKQLRPGGSGKKTLYKGKMWLQFETYFDL